MKKIVAIIEKGNDGSFSIYTEDIAGVVGCGESVDEAKSDFCEVIEEQAKYYKEIRGCYPSWYDGMSIEYRYDISGFFLAFPFINASEFAKVVGVNPSLMRQYKNGLAFASEKQRNVIQTEYSKVVRRMEEVVF